MKNYDNYETDYVNDTRIYNIKETREELWQACKSFETSSTKQKSISNITNQKYIFIFHYIIFSLKYYEKKKRWKWKIQIIYNIFVNSNTYF